MWAPLSRRSLRSSWISSIVGELHAGLLPGGAAAAEAVLDDPLGEGLGDDGDGVDEARALLHEIGGTLVGRGGDPVDHGGDDVDVVPEPGAGVLVCRGEHGLAQHVAVAGEVVAGDQGDGLGDAGLAAGLQAQRQAGGGGGRGVVAGGVALLGDGQGDHGGEGVGDQTHEGVDVVGRVDLVDDVDDADLVVLGAAHDQAVLAPLGVQGVGHRGGATGEGADGPASGALGVDQGVGAGEVADAEVDEAALVGGAGSGHELFSSCAAPRRKTSRGC